MSFLRDTGRFGANLILHYPLSQLPNLFHLKGLYEVYVEF